MISFGHVMKTLVVLTAFLVSVPVFAKDKPRYLVRLPPTHIVQTRTGWKVWMEPLTTKVAKPKPAKKAAKPTKPATPVPHQVVGVGCSHKICDDPRVICVPLDNGVCHLEVR